MVIGPLRCKLMWCLIKILVHSLLRLLPLPVLAPRSAGTCLSNGLQFVAGPLSAGKATGSSARFSNFRVSARRVDICSGPSVQRDLRTRSSNNMIMLQLPKVYRFIGHDSGQFWHSQCQCPADCQDGTADSFRLPKVENISPEPSTSEPCNVDSPASRSWTRRGHDWHRC